MLFCRVLLVGAGVAPMMLQAQEDGTNGPPKVLQIVREFTKPGKGGVLHERTEGAYVQALKENHVDVHYFAMTSLTGQDRALFFSGFASFADMEAANKSVAKNAAAAAAMDRANVADGDLLSETGSSVWLLRDDMSMNNSGITGDRYMQISEYMIKPGHDAEWEELVKLVKDGYAKGLPDAHWTMFESHYGVEGQAFLVVTPLKSLGEIDGMLGSDKAFMDAMGEGGMKKMAELEASCVESTSMNLFAFSPKMSNPPDAWVKAEPDYWGHKKMMMPMKKDEKKDATKPM